MALENCPDRFCWHGVGPGLRSLAGQSRLQFVSSPTHALIHACNSTLLGKH